MRLISPPSFWFYLGAFFAIILLRYGLIAGGTHWLFYSQLKQKVGRYLGRQSPQRQTMIADGLRSTLSSLVFAVGAAIVLCLYDRGTTLLYSDVHQYGSWYLGCSFVVVLLLQDAYFYGMHRWFHHPALFKRFHAGHHRSGDPTPWTSFAFDLPEAIVQALFLAGIVFIIPLHFFTLIAVLMVMTIWTVWNHLGFEFFPSSFPHHWFTKWLIGPTHHGLHHRKYTVHYGLYFTVWDKLIGTQDPRYETDFDGVLRNLDSQS